MTNDEFQMTKEAQMTKPESTSIGVWPSAIRHSDFVIPSSFVIRHSSL
jgi:hypothetical protein